MSTFWGVTINNPDENDYALIRNGYPDYCRELVWTREIGTEGTEHIQAWVRLQRQQRFSFMKKLFPKGHFECLSSMEFNKHTRDYVQKDNETTAGKHVQKYNDPLHTIENVIKRVVGYILYEGPPKGWPSEWTLLKKRKTVEKQMVRDDYKLAKIFVSATYSRMWAEFGEEMYQQVCETLEKSEDTHTHTHTDNAVESAVEIPMVEAQQNGVDKEEGRASPSLSHSASEDDGTPSSWSCASE